MNEQEIEEFIKNMSPSDFIDSEEAMTEDLRKSAKVGIACLLFRLAQTEELSGTEVGVMLFAVTEGRTRGEVCDRWTAFCRTMMKAIYNGPEEGVSDDVAGEALRNDLYKALHG